METGDQEAPRLEDGCLVLGQRRVPLWSGAVQYFRLDPADWAAALAGVRDLGLHIVDAYVPWSVHEICEGEYDFGSGDPRLDLARFLGLAHELGLLVYLRPGPHINAELAHFGIPARITLDPACQARSAAGNPVPMIAPPQAFAVPSYASRAFARATARWYEAVAEIARPRRWPAGPIALLQVDNEAAYYFRDGPYDQDYHPDSVAHFQRWVRRRYGTLTQVNRAHGTQASRFRDLEPPRRFDGSSRTALRRQLDWAHTREALLVDALGGMRDALTRAGLSDLPTLHNLPMGDGGAPAGVGALQAAVDLVGLDFYECRHQLELVRRRALRLAGSTELPFVPEMGVGGPYWLAPRDREDTLAVLLCCLAYGVRGFNLYMAVDRDRWYGAALTASGSRTEIGHRLRALMRTLDRVGFHRLTRRARVGLLVPAEYARLSRATHTLGFISPCVLDMAGLGANAACRQDSLGFERAIQCEFGPWLLKAEEALDRARIPFVYVDSAAPASRWRSLDAVFSPTYDYACPDRMAALADLEARGGRAFWGPLSPGLDTSLETMTPTPLPAGQCLDPVRVDGDLERAIAQLPSRCRGLQHWQTDAPGVQATVHEDEHGPRVLFATNFAREARTTRISLPGPCSLTDGVSGATLEGRDTLDVPLGSFECRMFVIERTRTGGSRPRVRRGQ